MNKYAEETLVKLGELVTARVTGQINDDTFKKVAVNWLEALLFPDLAAEEDRLAAARAGAEQNAAASIEAKGYAPFATKDEMAAGILHKNPREVLGNALSGFGYNGALNWAKNHKAAITANALLAGLISKELYDYYK